jgi:thioredoxin-related protein
MRKLLIAAAILFSLNATAQLKTWSFAEVDSMLNISPKPVVVFIQTSWCSYCYLMKERTLKNEKIIALLNERFYFLSFNAEEKNDVVFRGHRFKFRPSGNNTGINELAAELGSINGRIAYPAICVLNKKDEILLQKNGFLSSNQLLPYLTAVLRNE